MSGSLDSAVHDAGERDHRQQSPYVVHPWRVSLARVRHQPDRHHRHHRGEDRVEREDRLPLPDLEQQAGGEQTEDRARTGNSDPGSDSLSSQLPGKRRRDDGQGGGHHECRPDPHHTAQRDQALRVVSERGSA